MKHEQVDDAVLVDNYLKTGSIWKTAKELNLVGQTVYARLNRLGVVKHINYWTKEDDRILLAKYITYKNNGCLDELAAELGRTKQFICRKAKKLGLTDREHKSVSENTRLKISENTKKWIKEKGHPRGMTGHIHSDVTKNLLSDISRKMWKDPKSFFNSEENRQRLSDLLHERQIKGLVDVFSIRGKHPMVIGGNKYTFKSTWECDIANKLQDLKEHGDIKDWDYESKHFIFTDIRRGIRSYCPDFEVFLPNGKILYIEVKGWKMKLSMKRIAMFIERYPNVNFYLIDAHEYKKVISDSDYLRRRCV